MSYSTTGQAGETEVVPWDPIRYLRRIEAPQVRLSRGFLRCRPELWFPGLSAQWLPLAHALGVEIKVLDVKPVIAAARDFEHAFVGSIDGEPTALLMDSATVKAIEEFVLPGGKGAVVSLVAEYLARRLFATLGLAWSGPESSRVQFHRGAQLDTVREAGAVRLVFGIQHLTCALTMVLGYQTINRLDGLWRRQLRSTRKTGEFPAPITLEIAQLAINANELNDYLRPGTQVDMEVPIGDTGIARLNDAPWLSVRFCNLDGRFAIESLGPSVGAHANGNDGTTRLSVSFGSVVIDPSHQAELAQVGALFDCAPATQ
jgi:hypothetical protein